MRKPVLDYLANNKHLRAFETILDCCSGTRPQHYDLPGKVIKRHDQIKADYLDYGGDIHDLKEIPAQSQSCVTLLEALEHIAHPHLAIASVARILEDQGLFIMTTVMDFPIHRHPNDFWRFCPEGLALLLRHFKIVDFTVEGYLEKPRGLWVTAIKVPGDHLEHNLEMANNPHQVHMTLSRFTRLKHKLRMRLERWL